MSAQLTDNQAVALANDLLAARDKLFAKQHSEAEERAFALLFGEIVSNHCANPLGGFPPLDAFWERGCPKCRARTKELAWDERHRLCCTKCGGVLVIMPRATDPMFPSPICGTFLEVDELEECIRRFSLGLCVECGAQVCGCWVDES